MYARLENRLDRIAGFHSGMERGILDDQGASASTHWHEMTHDRVFYETADGLFHLLVHRLAEHATNPNWRKANGDFYTSLMDQTRAAHEAIATYMGIVYLEIDREDFVNKTNNPAALEYERLPPAYRGYYAIFGNFLDPYLHAPWLRIAIAWAIANWTFSSPRLSNATQLLSNHPSLLEELPGPDTRLPAALQSIANFGVSGWIRAILQETLSRCEKHGIIWVNIDNPAEWPDKTGVEKAEFTQSAIFDVIREWLNARVASSRGPREIDDRVAKLMTEYGFTFDKPERPLIYPLEQSLVDARAIVRAAERGRVHRHRPPDLRPLDLGFLQNLTTDNDLSPATLTLLVNFRWGAKKYRAIPRKGDHLNLPSIALNKAELQRLLRAWRKMPAIIPTLPPVVVCELNADYDALSSVSWTMARQGLAVRKVTSPLSEVTAGQAFLPFNYIDQGLSGILEQVPGVAYTIDVHTVAAGARLGVVLFLPADPELQACIRVVPRYDMGAYLIFQRALQENSGLRIGEAGDLHVAYRDMIQAIIQCWDPF